MYLFKEKMRAIPRDNTGEWLENMEICMGQNPITSWHYTRYGSALYLL